MVTVHTWRKLIGIFEILVGLLLISASAFLYNFLKISFDVVNLYTQVFAVEILIQISVLLLMLMVGLVILVNGIWKISSNKFIKTTSMQG